MVKTARKEIRKAKESLPSRAKITTLRHHNDMSSKQNYSSPSSGLQVLQNLSLVLIDDEPGVLRALSLLLQTLKCIVLPYSDPKSFVATLTTKLEADMILCDLRMPGLSGSQVLEHVRMVNQHIPFLLMSGHATRSDIDEATRLGVSGFLPKPFTPMQLAEEICRVRQSASRREVMIEDTRKLQNSR